MKLRIAFALTFLLIPTVMFAQKNTYVGYVHKGVIYGESLPNGVKDLGGGLLSDDSYGISRFTKGDKYMLWLEKITDRNKKGVPTWQVKDVLTFEKLKKNHVFMFSYSSPCALKGKFDLDLVVEAELQPKSKTYKVLDAWKANLKKEKFERVSIKYIKCAYVAS